MSDTQQHHIGLKEYFAVFGALMVLTAVTVWVAFMDFGFLNNVIAVGIAVIKGSLVILYFMHARYAGGLTGVVIAAGAAFFFILVFLTLSDYVTRSWSLTSVS